MADWVFVSCHCHEKGNSVAEPPAFLESFAHACIDAGADAFIGHGPHCLRGIEIYKDRPIFYSLGNFIFQSETVASQPANNYAAFGLGPDASVVDFQNARSQQGQTGFGFFPEYWHSVVAQIEFRQGKLNHVLLHPVELGFGLPRWQRGRPVLSSEAMANNTLETLQALSGPYHTRIQCSGGIGKIQL